MTPVLETMADEQHRPLDRVYPGCSWHCPARQRVGTTLSGHSVARSTRRSRTRRPVIIPDVRGHPGAARSVLLGGVARADRARGLRLRVSRRGAPTSPRPPRWCAPTGSCKSSRTASACSRTSCTSDRCGTSPNDASAATSPCASTPRSSEPSSTPPSPPQARQLCGANPMVVQALTAPISPHHGPVACSTRCRSPAGHRADERCVQPARWLFRDPVVRSARA